MGQLWVSASHLWDANQGLKLGDQPLRQSCSSDSEWLFKHRDARIDFSSSLKDREKRRGGGGSGGGGGGGLHSSGPVSAVAVCASGREPSPGPRSPSTDQGGLTEWPRREALNLQTRRGQGAGSSRGSGLVGATSAEISVIEKGFNLNVGAKTLLEAK